MDNVLDVSDLVCTLGTRREKVKSDLGYMVQKSQLRLSLNNAVPSLNGDIRIQTDVYGGRRLSCGSG